MVRIESYHRSGEGATDTLTLRDSYTVRVLALPALKRIQLIDLNLHSYTIQLLSYICTFPRI